MNYKHNKNRKSKYMIGVLLNVSMITTLLSGCNMPFYDIVNNDPREVTTETHTLTDSHTSSDAHTPTEVVKATVEDASKNVTAAAAEKENPRKDILIAIDPGHQSEDIDMSDLEPNAPSSSEMKAKAAAGTTGRFTEVPEYQLNLDISKLLHDALLKKGYKVLMTRMDNETAISNKDRACLANDAGADISIRIHANGSEDADVNGAMALVGSQSNPDVGELYDDSSRLAEAVLGEYCKATGMNNQGVSTDDTMTGINWSTIPVMILEMGYMTNREDDTNMQDPDYQEKMVEGIVNGIEKYYDFPEYEGDDDISSKLSENSKQIQDEALEYLEELRGEGAKCSAYMKNLSTGEVINLSEGRQKAASIIKLFVAGAVYRNMNDLLKEGYLRSEADEIIEDMITISDNDACNELVAMLGNNDYEAGIEIVNKYIESFGYKKTRMGRIMLDFDSNDENYIEASEVGDYLERLYKKTGVEGSDKIISYMKKQEYTEKIPSVLPEDVIVANKTGDLQDVDNDAAIVYGDKTDYIICVFTDEVEGTDTSDDMIKNISAITYRYWE